MSTPAGGIGSASSQPRVVSADVSGSSLLDPYVSIILPCYNEQDHVVAEVERICAAMDTSGYGYEVVAYDDASTDGTFARLHEAAPRFPHLRVVHFDRNGGAGTVRRIGTQAAQGEIVVWTDADMTYPNERIPELVQMLEKDPSLDQVVGDFLTRPRLPRAFVARASHSEAPRRWDVLGDVPAEKVCPPAPSDRRIHPVWADSRLIPDGVLPSRRLESRALIQREGPGP